MDHQDEMGENLLSEQHLQVKVPPLKYTSETQKDQSVSHLYLFISHLAHLRRVRSVIVAKIDF